MLKLLNHKPSSLHGMLACLTALFIAAQLSFYLIHYKVTELIDSLVNTSIVLQLLHPVILIPIILFLMIQLMAYAVFVIWIWFVSVSLGDLFKLSETLTYWLGILIWCVACLALLVLNSYYFPASFFAKLLSEFAFYNKNISMLLSVTACLLVLLTFAASINYFWFRRRRLAGSILLSVCIVMLLFALYDTQYPLFVTVSSQLAVNKKPNIILIGLDSLRPDFTGYYGDSFAHTPNIDSFLRSATTFNHAYTPLARTFPAWISILTSKYPKHNFARNNLVDPERVLTNDTLAKRLQQAGYETIYATDEKRFSNITTEYGFDKVLGPSMGVNDFLLGSLTDFPLSNLLINLPIGRMLFPFNYGNRAAAITYEPDKFLQLVKLGIAGRTGKPVFMSIHLCLSHWPFTWAHDRQNSHQLISDQYRGSIEAVDNQLGKLLQMLKEDGLLENSLVVLLSDHGTALGLRGDRIISEKTYRGDKNTLKLIQTQKLSTAPQYSTDHKHDFTINTAYGQGTNVLSLKQYQVVLAFRRFGGQMSVGQINEPGSLLDITPTILDFLAMSPMRQGDGISLLKYLSSPAKATGKQRALFMETGDSMTEIETDHIYIEKVIKHQIGIYDIDPESGLLKMNPKAEKSIIKNKQLAVMWKGWYLARYPARLDRKLVLTRKNKNKSAFAHKTIFVPPYFVLANLKTGQWTIGLTSPLAKTAPVQELMHQLKGLYGSEIN